MLGAILAPGDRVRHEIPAGRVAWVQVARGEVSVNGQGLRAGDGLSAVDETALSIVGGGTGDAEVLVFDLAG